MMRGRIQDSESLGLRAGEVVEVKSREEILATLDETGALDKLPFMPEMLAFSGRQFVVTRRADKSCDTVSASNKRLRRFVDTVHLDDTRCDGSAHGGCQAQCTLFWKEAWLRRVERPAVPSPTLSTRTPPLTPRLTEQQLYDAAYRDKSGPEPIFRCQATDHAIASAPLNWWWPLQYVRDVRSGNVTLGQSLKAILWWALRRGRVRLRGYKLQVWLFNVVARMRGGMPLEELAGDRVKTPRETLDLVSGELVRIKTVGEIKLTLDANQKNRGLYFDQEMLPFCGQTYRVRGRVSQIIEEPTGRMMKIPGDCILLEGTACTGKYHMSCPRAILPYWREVWLRRADAPGVPPAVETEVTAVE
jgi:hypothetical protein